MSSKGLPSSPSLAIAISSSRESAGLLSESCELWPATEGELASPCSVPGAAQLKVKLKDGLPNIICMMNVNGDVEALQ